MSIYFLKSYNSLTLYIISIFSMQLTFKNWWGRSSHLATGYSLSHRDFCSNPYNALSIQCCDCFKAILMIHQFMISSTHLHVVLWYIILLSDNRFYFLTKSFYASNLTERTSRNLSEVIAFTSDWKRQVYKSQFKYCIVCPRSWISGSDTQSAWKKTKKPQMNH